MVVAVFFLVIITFALGRLAWSAVFAAHDSIRVANIFRTFDICWQEIDHFDLGRSGIFPAVCRIHKKDGSVVRAFGIQESNYSAMRKLSAAKQMVEDLNRELTAHSA